MGDDPKMQPEGTLVVPVPHGMTWAEATERLARPADAEWPLARDIWPDGIPAGLKVRCRDEWVSNDYESTAAVRVHPDDVPTDPDADLVKAMASDMAQRRVGYPFSDMQAQSQTGWIKEAKAVIAFVREYEAQS